MKRILIALCTLATACLVSIGAGAITASAASGCGVNYTHNFNPVLDGGQAACSYLAPGGEGAHGGEKVRVYIYCWNSAGAMYGGGEIGTPIYGAWKWLNNEWSTVNCPAGYVYTNLAHVHYEIGTGP